VCIGRKAAAACALWRAHEAPPGSETRACEYRGGSRNLGEPYVEPVPCELTFYKRRLILSKKVTKKVEKAFNARKKRVIILKNINSVILSRR